MNGISRRCLGRTAAAALAVLVFAIVSAGSARADALHVTDDAFVYMVGGKAKKNFGKAQSLVVSSKGKGQVVFLRFDLSAVPSTTTVDTAVLRLWVGKSKIPGDIDVLLIPAPGEGKDLWDEDTITGNNAPDLNLATFVTTFSVAEVDANDFVTVDLTSEVRGWVNDPLTNYGIALVPSEDNGIVKPVSVIFDSKENVRTSHLAEVEIIGEGVEGPQGIPGPAGADGTLISKTLIYTESQVTTCILSDPRCSAVAVCRDANDIAISGYCFTDVFGFDGWRLVESGIIGNAGSGTGAQLCALNGDGSLSPQAGPQLVAVVQCLTIP